MSSTSKPPRKFLYSDPHFGHAKVIQYENRPFSTVEEMNDELVKRWNKVVTPRDHVFMLGDFCFGDDDLTYNLMHELNGHKHIITGNHDRDITINKWFTMGAMSVYHQAVLQLSNRVRVKLCHFPYAGKDGDDRYSHSRPVKEDLWLIHGHSHGRGLKIDYENKSICVSVEHWNYTPVDADKILDIINKDKNGLSIIRDENSGKETSDKK